MRLLTNGLQIGPTYLKTLTHRYSESGRSELLSHLRYLAELVVDVKSSISFAIFDGQICENFEHLVANETERPVLKHKSMVIEVGVSPENIICSSQSFALCLAAPANLVCPESKAA